LLSWYGEEPALGFDPSAATNCHVFQWQPEGQALARSKPATYGAHSLGMHLVTHTSATKRKTELHQHIVNYFY
jgi:hypothetical protein